METKLTDTSDIPSWDETSVAFAMSSIVARYYTRSSGLKETWKTIQKELKSRLIVDRDVLPVRVRYIGGVDISFAKDSLETACACLAVYDCESRKVWNARGMVNGPMKYHPLVSLAYDVGAVQVVYKALKLVELTEPYISGFLAFREVPHILPLLHELKESKENHFYPDVLFVDGNGILHPEGFGFASQLGVEADLPTIGVAKKLLCVDGLNRKLVGDAFREKVTAPGCTSKWMELRGKSGKVHGAAVQATDDVEYPIFVSLNPFARLINCHENFCVQKDYCNNENQLHYAQDYPSTEPP